MQQLSEHHGVPVCAIHAPCLLFTQRVWGTEPWGKLERSAEMAAAVGAAEFLHHVAATGFRGEIVLEINTRKAAGRADREKDLRESLAFAREHFFAQAP